MILIFRLLLDSDLFAGLELMVSKELPDTATASEEVVGAVDISFYRLRKPGKVQR